ncbi:very-long-chain 3-oxooacyl-coA reductase [Ditylenchus destructor]|uniref:Very-long-chain 3-oxooacyl-coA reductase n=1 Tax=Ditylenchus destructor TaxID=166010 RepID=A0AAD4R6W6_9BILA|nr:very-long-chain 3-oxooacyl-coA reductase [Ditylenchus destructor]
MVYEYLLTLAGYGALAFGIYKIFQSLYATIFPYLFAVPHDLQVLAGAKWAIVTGSTDGIGMAYAYELASKGFDLIIFIEEFHSTSAPLSMCFRKKKDKTSAATSASAIPGSMKGDMAATLSPVTVTSESKVGGRPKPLNPTNPQTDVTQNTVNDDSFATIQPSVKTAKRAKEIQRQGSISGKRKKQYKTFNAEDMSDFNKTMELAEQDPEFTCISGGEKVPKN